jgi:hypothetical protein
MKENPFPWLPWWPKVEESHYLFVIAAGIVLGIILIYFAF